MERPSKKARLSSDKEARAEELIDAGSTISKKAQSRRQLFVRSLPPTATTESLTEFFSQSYPLKHATAVLDPHTKLCKGYGFVTFADAEDALQAREEFNGKEFEGKAIKVEAAEPRARGQTGEGSRPQPSKSPSDRQPPPKLIVRNLPWTIKKPEQLARLFQSFGKIKFTDLPTKDHGKMAGYGFVTIRGRKNAEKALESMNGKEIEGRTLAVDWAVDKTTWEEFQSKETAATEPGVPEYSNNARSNSDSDVEERPDEDETGSYDENLTDDDDENLEMSDLEGNSSADDREEDSIDDDEGMDLDSEPKSTDPTADTTMTLFVRNVPFTTTDDDLFQHFRQFGALKYARVVYDQATERPKGSGFVCFYKPDEAIACLKSAPKPDQAASTQSSKKKASSLKRSLLENELSDPSGRYSIADRVLHVSPAVNKEEAGRLEEQGKAHRDRRDRDKRRLYLLAEGTIPSNSPLFTSLPPSEVAMRETSIKQRKTILQGNPALHLSLTRLSIRNIPRSVDSKDLKALARKAVVEFAKDVREGKRQQLSKEENARGGEEMKEAERARRLKGKGIVKQAKVVFESREGKKVSEDSGAGRSRGYGFVEYTSHRWALMGLRWLNGHMANLAQSREPNVDASERKNRLIVEFAIENMQVMNRRKERELKLKGGSKSNGRKQKERAGPNSRSDSDQEREGTSKKEAGSSDSAEAKRKKLAKRQIIVNKKRKARKIRAKSSKT